MEFSHYEDDQPVFKPRGAAPTPDAHSEVGVKALEWVGGMAETPFFRYFVGRHVNGSYRLCISGTYSATWTEHQTLDDLEAAAQADFVKRVLSCLTAGVVKAEPVAWQKIETAPKDGTKFIAFSVRNGQHDFLRWTTGENGYVDHFTSALGYGGVPIAHVTHWAPMPTYLYAALASKPEGER